MSEPPLVTVIMSVYNDEQYVGEAVDSILEQTYQNFELLLIDDGSTDGSKEILGEYATQEPVTLVQNDENKGLTASLNRGIDAASGKYIARQDADDRSRPTRLERQVEYLESHPDVGLVGTDAIMIDADGSSVRRRHVPSRPSQSELLEQNHFVHGSVMLRRGLLEAVGGYDELFKYAQDYDLWLRLAKRTTLRNIPEPLYGFREHGERIAETNMFESLLYKHLAIEAHYGGRPELLDKVRSVGIEAMYDEFDQRTHAELHRTAAEVCLQQRDLQAVREHSRQLLEANNTAFIGYLLYLLSFTRVGATLVVTLYYEAQRRRNSV